MTPSSSKDYIQLIIISESIECARETWKMLPQTTLNLTQINKHECPARTDIICGRLPSNAIAAMRSLTMILTLSFDILSRKNFS